MIEETDAYPNSEHGRTVMLGLAIGSDLVASTPSDTTNSDTRDHTAYRLPAALVGPVPHARGHILVNKSRKTLDLDYLVLTRVVQVGVKEYGAGLEFRRSTCHQQSFRRDLPVNVYIMPPMDYEAAVDAVTVFCPGAIADGLPFATLRRGDSETNQTCTTTRREEAFIDMRHHGDAIFCSVFLDVSGSYEAAIVFARRKDTLISTTSWIFAPSAWMHGAVPVANRGKTTDTHHRLICRLENGDIVKLNVPSVCLGMPDGWVKRGWT
ncbi:hypothetical protein DFH06DRAFT_1127594 [Mycena polygramma]|nr:hypothetical protein DFH06DRAFT_1127594 [Mycena polygramma]